MGLFSWLFGPRQADVTIHQDEAETFEFRLVHEEPPPPPPVEYEYTYKWYWSNGKNDEKGTCPGTKHVTDMLAAGWEPVREIAPASTWGSELLAALVVLRRPKKPKES